MSHHGSGRAALPPRRDPAFLVISGRRTPCPACAGTRSQISECGSSLPFFRALTGQRADLAATSRGRGKRRRVAALRNLGPPARGEKSGLCRKVILHAICLFARHSGNRNR